MGTEIERKFLIQGMEWRDEVERSEELDQGYIRSDDATVRVRTIDERGFITLKGPTTNVTRAEYEYEIPVEDAREMLEKFCGDRRIRKVRHTVIHEGHEWVIDEFMGANEGLLLAEIELDAEDESFAHPDWVGEEVSGEKRYYNSTLAQNPVV